MSEKGSQSYKVEGVKIMEQKKWASSKKNLDLSLEAQEKLASQKE